MQTDLIDACKTMAIDKKRCKSRKSHNTSSKKEVQHNPPAPHNSIIIVEPFYGGSHKQLVDLLFQELSVVENRRVYLLKLPATKWHWRLRCSALYFAEIAPKLSRNNQYIFFCSSMFDLSTFLSLRPDYNSSNNSKKIVQKILYFHENQLAYPTRQENAYKREIRDFQFGYIQILSSLVADRVCFNSDFNRQSFLKNISAHFKKLPTNQKLIKGAIEKRILSKSEILYSPINVAKRSILIDNKNNKVANNKPLHIVWNHRWEHDKNPLSFFQVISRLMEEVDNISISISVVGESFGEIPDTFHMYKKIFDLDNNYYNGKLNVKNWGYVDSKEAYFSILNDADVVVSTALHEFYGVSVLEAVLHSCFPLVPNRLVYPEIYGIIPGAIYNTDNQLFKKLKDFALRPNRFRLKKEKLLQSKAFYLQKYIWHNSTIMDNKQLYNNDHIEQASRNLKLKYKRLFNVHTYNVRNSSATNTNFILIMVLVLSVIAIFKYILM